MAVSVYNNLTQNTITTRRKEALEKYIRIILWGRKHPVAFIEKIFKIKLMDYQAYVIEGTWTSTSACWVCSRNAGKTFIGALYLMTRAILFPSMKIRILAPVARQSQETFTKLEDIAKKNISSLMGSSDVFINEIVKTKADSDGITHDQTKGWSLELFNGSVISTVKGTEKTAVSLRSNLNFYDECFNITDTYATATEAFCAQDKDFKTGVGIDTDVLPMDIPNQIIYASSAGDTDSYLWKKYRENSMKMIMGIPGYFVADISCEMPLHPTINGEPFAPLLTQQKIDDDMRANESKAIREYFNKFSKTGGANSVFRSSDIVRNTEEYFPAHKSEGKNKKYIITYDPALQNDNSILLIMEYWQDKATKQWRGRIVNMKNLMEVQIDGAKHPMRTPDQIDTVRQMLIDYNGEAAPYENVKLYIDSGSGGGGRAISEHLWTDFKDKQGNTWPGVIDLTDEECAAQQDKYPKAKDIVRLIEPRKLRQKMFEAASEMVKEGYIVFPMEMPRTSTIMLDEKETIVGEDDFKSFLEFDLLKEEMKAFVKEETQAGNPNYKIPTDKSRKMHDDRAYAFVMAAYFVSELNRAALLDTEEKSSGLDEYYKGKEVARSNNTSIRTTRKNNINPFGKIDRPFSGLRMH